MQDELGLLLKQLREAQGWSLRGLAVRSGVTQPALGHWEKGVHAPRLPELEGVLNALEATPLQRERALALVRAPRAVARQRVEAERRAPGFLELAGPAPGGGDLLRALRMRAGKTLAETAEAVGVHVATLSRWEGTETWPAPDALERFCAWTQASPAEQAALRQGCMPSAWRAALSLDALAAQIEALQKHLYRADTAPVIEVELLAIEAALWAKAQRQTAARELLSRCHSIHSQWLAFLLRYREAQPHAEKALALEKSAGGARPSAYALTAAINIARALARAGTPRPERGLEWLRHWQSAAEKTLHASWMCNMEADFLAEIGCVEEALRCNRRYAHLPRENGGTCAEDPRGRYEMACIWMKAGEPRQALTLLAVGRLENTTTHCRSELLRCEALLACGEMADAEAALQSAIKAISQDKLSFLKPRAQTLARRF